MTDPRVYFAAERTVLAWVRTGLTVMGLGFVVARFGLFLAVISAASTGAAAAAQHHPHGLSNTLGLALVALGAAVILGALQNHRVFVRSLPADDIPEVAVSWLTSALALAVAMLGFLLAAYLAIA